MNEGVIVIDDHQSVRDGIKEALRRNSIQCVGEAASRSEAMAFIAQKNPSAIIVDLNLPDGSGLEIITWVRKISQTITIIVLSLHEDDAHILAAMRAGASAYVFKSEPITALMSALKHGLDSPLKFSVKGLYEIVARQKDVFELSTRELEVIALLPSGKTTRELASSLYISEATVKSHLASIFRKLHVKNKLAAVLKAREAGLY